MPEFAARDLHLVKKELAIAVRAIERQPGPFQSASDQADIKALLDKLIESDTELEHYARSARIAVTGEPPLIGFLPLLVHECLRADEAFAANIVAALTGPHQDDGVEQMA